MEWRGIFAAVLGLSALTAVTSSEAAGKRAGGLVQGVADITRHILSPFEPAIPDLRDRPPREPPTPEKLPPNFAQPPRRQDPSRPVAPPQPGQVMPPLPGV